MAKKALATVDAATSEPGREILVPLAKLYRSPLNVRKQGGADVQELAASILSNGILQNLVVTAETKKGRLTGRYGVVAGGRRLDALSYLLFAKRITSAYAVRCLEVDEDRAVEVSTAENVEREALHPADECAAFQAMIDAGKTIAEVANAFGITTTIVLRRLKLANVAPSLMSLFRSNEITGEQLMALALTDDHAKQEAVWRSASSWQRTPDQLRARLTEDEIDASSSSLARFVGVDAYEAAGGMVRRDIFSDDVNVGYLTDAALLERLAVEKLEAVAAGLEGVAWVHVRPHMDYAEMSAFGHAPTQLRDMTPEEFARHKALQAERETRLADIDSLEAACGEEGFSDDEQTRMEWLEEAVNAAENALDELRESVRVPDPAFSHLVGAVVTLAHDGTVQIRRNLVQPEDRAKIKQSATSNATHDDDSDDGGTTSAGVAPGKGEYSERLYRHLTAHRTAALQLAIATNSNVGLALTAWRLGKAIFDRYDYRSASAPVVHINVTIPQLNKDAPDLHDSPAGKQFDALRERWGSWYESLPGDGDKLLTWALLSADEATLHELIAFCVACSFDDVYPGPDEGQRDVAATVAHALTVDMADWWSPTATTYLAAIPKSKILDAVLEARGAEAVQPLKLLKKDALIAAAEQALAGSRWLPPPLR